jgi:glycosyltransferase involved in cell wall biosynthesis
MNLLIVNYEMDDSSPVLAWQASVARRLASAFNKVVVFTERIGTHTLLSNMEVFALPYRRSTTSLNFNPASSSFFSLLDCHNINVCFIHMAHRWSYTLFPHTVCRSIPLLLWYAHGSVTPHLRRALSCVSRVVTSTPEGFRIPSPKIFSIGQGINTSLFTPPQFVSSRNTIISIGRISRRKRIHLLVDVVHALHQRGFKHLSLRLVGPQLTDDDRNYWREVESRIEERNLGAFITYLGALPQGSHPQLYVDCFVHLNMSLTGSMDKTVLEALSCGCPVLTTNPAFETMLHRHKEFFCHPDEVSEIATRCASLYEQAATYPPQELRGLVENNHDEASYVNKVIEHLHQLHETASARY